MLEAGYQAIKTLDGTAKLVHSKYNVTMNLFYHDRTWRLPLATTRPQPPHHVGPNVRVLRAGNRLRGILRPPGAFPAKRSVHFKSDFELGTSPRASESPELRSDSGELTTVSTASLPPQSGEGAAEPYWTSRIRRRKHRAARIAALDAASDALPVSYTHLTLPTTPYV